MEKKDWKEEFYNIYKWADYDDKKLEKFVQQEIDRVKEEVIESFRKEAKRRMSEQKLQFGDIVLQVVVDIAEDLDKLTI